MDISKPPERLAAHKPSSVHIITVLLVLLAAVVRSQCFGGGLSAWGTPRAKGIQCMFEHSAFQASPLRFRVNALVNPVSRSVTITGSSPALLPSSTGAPIRDDPLRPVSQSDGSRDGCAHFLRHCETVESEYIESLRICIPSPKPPSTCSRTLSMPTSPTHPGCRSIIPSATSRSGESYSPCRACNAETTCESSRYICFATGIPSSNSPSGRGGTPGGKPFERPSVVESELTASAWVVVVC